MNCQEIECWTFNGLVGAFLDLSIAYLLLCASTLAYLASKFLGLLGLCLPCPCNGLFGNPNGNNDTKCLQRYLVDYPPERISSAQFSIISKFPFDSILAQRMNFRSNSKYVNERNNEHAEFEGEASCSSFSGKRSQDVVGNGGMNSPVVKAGRLEIKGRRLATPRQRYGLRRRRKFADGHGKFLLVSSYDASRSDKQAVPQSPASNSGMDNSEGSGAHVNIEDRREGSMDADLPEKDSFGKMNETLDENKVTGKDALLVEEFNYDAKPELGLDGIKLNAIRVLEQALQEEHAARSALYLELEKERSAAASAADEALAMILRLQEEKALIIMEKKQYQRMIEEKSAYDAEEMNILKEILVRREREKHFLEKEVEAYRRTLFGNEQLDSVIHDMVDAVGQRTSSLYSSEDPMPMLHRISEFFGEKQKDKNASKLSEHEVTSLESQNRTLDFGKELPVPELDEDNDFLKLEDIHTHLSVDENHLHTSRSNNEINQECNDKGMLFGDKNQVDQEREVQRLEECTKVVLLTNCQSLNMPDKTTIEVGEEKEQGDGTETLDKTKVRVPYNDDDIESHGKDLHSSAINREPWVLDVHVIDDDSVLREPNGHKNEQLSINATLNIPRMCDRPTISSLETVVDMNRSSSDITNGLPPLGFSRGKALLADMRRNSMSSFDYERLKIDNEVGWLRERLRVVQKGREKLKFSAEHRERENVHLQLLDDTACQHRGIPQLPQPGKPERQVSLPRSSSKIMSMKRGRRSVSFAVRRSC
ncbi:Zein-binding domain-containing protein [Cephalotus follicularis]|uniref:Zein-binding domain-containing protein n=1 Tax=Cephalotus follicularis TaxID=3775 RepID=A0A1Q3BI84_CEPFO|nr:Zein-binding domain-containing protein [Cephalotus follicularis]